MTVDDVARSFTGLVPGDDAGFEAMADVVLAYQRAHNPVYGRYCKAISPTSKLPTFLPIDAFKRAPVTTFSPEEAQRVFESSGTGRGAPSRHYVRQLDVYDRSAVHHFRAVFGAGPFMVASYLPGYRSRGGTSSLLYMMERLTERFGHPESASFIGHPARLRDMAARSEIEDVPLLVFGAAFGLLDLVEAQSFRLPEGARIVETGGMKTYRREVGRTELHARLAAGFGLHTGAIYSEYGMCELLSQCYSTGRGIFNPPPWMRAWIVDPDRPFEPLDEGESGALAVLDLANLYSASAIVTQDRAVRRGDGFEILGRLSGAELRGCNFLLEHV